MFLLKKAMAFSISVYEGISPALLATISLSQNIKGNNHNELIQSLKKSNIVQSQLILNALKQFDRSHFTNIESPYQNKPYSIGEGECMTDIFTHSIILANLEPLLKKDNLKILDIGTGHGYLSFVIHQIIKKNNITNFQVVGVDCSQTYITKCNELKEKFNKQSDATLKFKVIDVNDLSEMKEQFDAIIGGFFIQPQLSKKLVNILKEEGVGIWPSLSESGQALFKFNKNSSKQYLLQTLFSQQRVKSSVDEYFMKESDVVQEEKIQQEPIVQNKEQKLQHLRKQKQQLQNLLKQLILKQKQKQKKSILTLQQMKNNQKISQVLGKLKRFK